VAVRTLVDVDGVGQIQIFSQASLSELQAQAVCLWYDDTQGFSKADRDKTVQIHVEMHSPEYLADMLDAVIKTARYEGRL
jgi:hypothetical protein